MSIPRYWGAGGEGQEGQIWSGGQPGPEMDIIQYNLNREMIVSGQGVNSEILGSRGGRPGRADMARRPARPRDGHYSIEFE